MARVYNHASFATTCILTCRSRLETYKRVVYRLGLVSAGDAN